MPPTTRPPLPDDPRDQLQHEHWAQADRFALTAALFEGSLAVAAVALGWALGINPLESLRWEAAALGFGIAGIVPLLVLLAWSMRSRLRPLRTLRRFFDRSIVPLFAPLSITELAVLSILAGVGEEMLFRGIVQEGIASAVGGTIGILLGLGVAALLFGFAHALSPAYFVLASLIGLYLGVLWLVTANLLVPIVTHAGYDFAALYYLARYRSRRLRLRENKPPSEGKADPPAAEENHRSE